MSTVALFQISVDYNVLILRLYLYKGIQLHPSYKILI